MTAKKGSEIVGTSLIVGSPDGKSQNVTLISADAALSPYSEKAKEAKAKGFRNQAFYDKE